MLLVKIVILEIVKPMLSPNPSSLKSVALKITSASPKRYTSSDTVSHSKWLSHNLKSNRKYSTETEYNKTKHYKNRTKRSVKSMSCNVHLVADHMFYEQIGRKSTQETVSELVYRLGDADVIFRATDFNAFWF
jgi:signal recognition particle GTPase